MDKQDVYQRMVQRSNLLDPNFGAFIEPQLQGSECSKTSKSWSSLR